MIHSSKRLNEFEVIIMEYKNDYADRKKEIVWKCLDVFTKKGLVSTTSRDLSAALNLQNAGIYYYFKSKDDLVIACAEEAAITMETQLIAPLINQLNDPDEMVNRLRKKADEFAPLMRFLAQAFATPKYHEKLIPTLSDISKRYRRYAEKFAEALNTNVETIEPYVYIGITAATNYMIFGDNSFIKPQFDLIKQQLKQFSG